MSGTNIESMNFDVAFWSLMFCDREGLSDEMRPVIQRAYQDCVDRLRQMQNDKAVVDSMIDIVSMSFRENEECH